MNPHVLLVHFPIALLTLYCILEVLWLKRLRDLPYFFYIKAFLIITGELGSLAAYLTGETAEHAFRGQRLARQVIEMHSNFASMTVALFGAIAAAYAVAWLGRLGYLSRYAATFNFAERFLAGWWMPLLALIGLALVTITGTLGGAVAFGPGIDPLSDWIYNLFNFNS